MSTPPHIIALALICFFGTIYLILRIIISKRNQITEGTIIEKRIEPKNEVTYVQMVCDIPVFMHEKVPAKYYFIIEGYDRNHKLRIITVEITKDTYNQYKIGETWQASN